MNFAYPKDLAVEVDKKLKESGVTSKLNEQDLINLFEIMYFASLKTEELEQIKLRITILDKEIPDPKPPRRIVKNRWSFVEFKENIVLTIQNLVKIAKAANPIASAIAVDVINGELVIWGMIDQEYRYHDFLFNESNRGPERPGVIQVEIESLGEINVFREYELLGSLRKNTLISNQNKIFNKGPIYEKLIENMASYLHFARKKVGDEIYYQRDHWDISLINRWISVICRILIHIKDYSHGGAILISSQELDSDVNIKYNINYNRLSELMPNYAACMVRNRYYSDDIFKKVLNKDNDLIPYRTINKSECEYIDLKEYEGGITGSIKFISSLSCVDGLVLLDNSLRVKGFGVEITNTTVPENVYLSKNETADDLVKLDYFHFGTRHRSMMRYCSAHPGSIGFVISQDGDIRAITKIENKLIVWENIKISMALRS